MTRITKFALFLFLISSQLFAQTAVNPVIIPVNNGLLEITILDKNTVHVRIAPGTHLSKAQSLVVNKDWKLPVIKPVEYGDFIKINTGAFNVVVNKKTGVVSFKRLNDEILLTESDAEPRVLKAVTVLNEPCYEIKQSFSLTQNEALYGLGQPQSDVLNWRNKTLDLVQNNKNIAIPMLVSTNNWGLYWDNYSHTRFTDNEHGMSLWSEVADEINYYFFYGENPDKIIAAYRNATGNVPMLPKWAFGYWQSKERYKSEEELLNIAAEYRKRKIPIDNLVQDWEYWGKTGWSSMEFNKALFPSPKRLMDSLHQAYHINAIISIWPIVDTNSHLGRELENKGYLFKTPNWVSTGFIYDAYSKEARDIYWKYVNKGILSQKFDGLWMDATEPELRWEDTLLNAKKLIESLGKNTKGTFARFLNPYPLMDVEGVYNHFRETYPDKRIVILTRSAFAGQQRTGSILWSGDVLSSWKILHRQIAEGINIGFSGMPYWNSDIGGFFVHRGTDTLYKGLDDPYYRELYVRWFQFGAFNPMFRSHGTNVPREMWRFGEPGTPEYDALYLADELRYRLYPYIYSTAWKVTNDSYTMMRGLAFDFANDKQVFNIDNQYMFGPSMMIRPITESQFDSKDTKASVYLPTGASWINFWTGETFSGGKSIECDAPLSMIPLFIKSGSIIPLANVKQYYNESSDKELEIRVYPGSNGSFNLYEDEETNMNYSKGKYSTIPFDWNNSTRTLTIGNRKGAFTGMLLQRKFKIVLVSAKNGIGVLDGKKIDKTVTYNGHNISVQLK